MPPRPPGPPEGDPPAPPKPKKEPRPKGTSGKRRRSKASKRPDTRAWLRIEALVWLAGLAAGLLIASLVTWADARREVRLLLETPAASTPTSVWSAPIRVRRGEPYPKADLVADLIAGGYEQSEQADRPSTFHVKGDVIEILTAPTDLPGGRVAAQRGTIRLADDRVASTDPADGLLLHPTVLGVFGDLSSRRSPVRRDEVSPWMIPALLAIEDARFHDHLGVDPIGLLRALAHNLTSDEVQGGSTLTQQLAKNLFLDARRTLHRKVREVFYAAALESELDKDELLELYLSEVYLGHHGGLPVHGVEQAARAWFGRSASSLTVAQAATIAGVISSPNRASPLRDPERARERRDQVLHRMVYVRALTEAQAQEALATPLSTIDAPPTAAWRLPWVVSAALAEATALPGEPFLPGSGQHLHTTVQPHLQRASERAAVSALDGLAATEEGLRGAELAVAAVEVSTGRVLALVGGRDYLASPFHRATDAWRQGGSTVKPLVALAAMQADASLNGASLLDDAPISRSFDGQTWRPQNYDGRYLGPVTLREAIEQSRNIPAVLLAERVGRTSLREFLERAGLSRATALPSAALGAFPTNVVELAGAYAAFPNGGRRVPPHLIAGIRDALGREVYEASTTPDALAGPRAAALTRRLLEGVIEHGTGRGARAAGLTGAIGGKTGTTDDGRDAWFVGFDGERSLAVWTGLDRGTLGLTGGEAALPVWTAVLQSWGGARGGLRDGVKLVQVELCADDGLPACPDCAERRTEWFPPESVPAAPCPREPAAVPAAP
jgi:penicillin-binding protein 1B